VKQKVFMYEKKKLYIEARDGGVNADKNGGV